MPDTQTTIRAFRAGYEQAKADAIDRCKIEKDGRASDNAIDRCIRAIEPLDVRHALARKRVAVEGGRSRLLEHLLRMCGQGAA